MPISGTVPVLKGTGEPMCSRSRPARVLRLASRLVVSGSAHNVCLLSANLDSHRFKTWLACGRPGEGERSYVELARSMGVEPIYLETMQRKIGFSDFGALLAVRKLLREVRPQLVHTHTAKAGAIGRAAVRLTQLPDGIRPLVVHTFHGHVFHGHFGAGASRVVAAMERNLARITDVIIAVSDGIKRELTETYRIAPPEKVRVIRLGFDFDWTSRLDPNRGWLRARFGIPEDSVIVGIVGRMAPIKNYALALHAFHRFVCLGNTGARLVLFGDGALRPALEAQARDLGIVNQVHFAGWELDRAKIYSDLNLTALTSLNEGTPVALIESLAAGIPVVATRVGGVPDVVVHGPDGELTESGDVTAFAQALARVSRHGRVTDRRRDQVRCAFSVERLVRDTESLYEEVLESQEAADKQKLSALLAHGRPV